MYSFCFEREYFFGSVCVWSGEVDMVAASELVVIADSGGSTVARKLCFRNGLFRKRYEI